MTLCLCRNIKAIEIAAYFPAGALQPAGGGVTVLCAKGKGRSPQNVHPAKHPPGIKGNQNIKSENSENLSLAIL